MAVTGSKGWYIKHLKDAGITTFEGKKLKQYKTFVVANLYHKHIKGAN